MGISLSTSVCSEILERMRSSKRVRIFTLTGVQDHPVPSGTQCEGPYITITTLHYYRGVPCYPLVVECREEEFRYAVLENFGKIYIIPRCVVERVENGIVVVKRVDGILFKVKDLVLSHIY